MTKQTQPQGTLVIQIVAMPADTNANGDIFGGWLVSHMDMGAAIAARRRAFCRVVTVAIDSLVFYKPVNVGDTVCGYARLLRTGTTSMQIKLEVWTLSFPNNNDGPEENKFVAEGLFTFVAINEKGKSQPIDRHQTSA